MVCIIPRCISLPAFYSSFTKFFTTIIGNLGFFATCEMAISGSTVVKITIFARLTDDCIVLELRNIDEVVNILLLKELDACWLLEKFWKVALKGMC